MKASKFIILAAGILGLLAFFLPLVAVKDSGVKGALSAFQIVKGLDGAQDQVSANAKELDVQLAAMDATVNGRAATSKDADEALGAVKTIVMIIFAPALLLALIGGVGAARKKLGRLGGVGALLFGLVGLGFWAILNAGANEVATAGGTDVKGIGMWMLLLTGLGGVVGGLLTLVKPDRGLAATPAKA